MVFQYYTVQQHRRVEVARVKADQIQEEQVDDLSISLAGGLLVQWIEDVAHDQTLLIGVLKFFLIAIAQPIKTLNEIVGSWIVSNGHETFLL